MKTITITCAKCGNKCKKPFKEIARQKRGGRIKFYCSLSCSASGTQTTTHTVTSECRWCQKKFETTTHKRGRKCCSLNCAHKYSQSFVDKEKISMSMKKAWKRGDFDKSHSRVLYPRIYDFVCVICKTPFRRITKKLIKPVQTCSDKCYRELLRKNSRNNPNCGGDTNYKKYKYNGIWMDSNWEVELAKWMDNQNITWERSRKLHRFIWTDKDGNKRRYYPDFYLPKYNVYLDPKNKYLIGVDDYKMNQVIKENKITLFWGLLENVKKEIDNLRKV
jgi:hypothetical protein